MGSGVSTMVWPNDNDPYRCRYIFVSGRRRFVCGMRYVSPYHISRTLTAETLHSAGHIQRGTWHLCGTMIRQMHTSRGETPLYGGSILRYVTMWCRFRRRYVEVIRRKSAHVKGIFILPSFYRGSFFLMGIFLFPSFYRGSFCPKGIVIFPFMGRWD